MLVIAKFLYLIFIPGSLLLLTFNRNYKSFLLLGPLIGLIINSLFICFITSIIKFKIIHVYYFDSLIIIFFLWLYLRNEKMNIAELFSNMKIRFPKKSFLIFIFFFILGSTFTFLKKPHEFVISFFGMDPPTYLVQAEYQIHNGTFFLENYQKDIYEKDFPQTEWRMHSFAGSPKENTQNKREFKFPPLWKCALSTALIVGDRNITIYLNYLLLLISSGLIFYLLRLSSVNLLLSCLGSLFFFFSPLTLQVARHTTAEPFFLATILIGFYLFFSSFKFQVKVLAIHILASSILIKTEGTLFYLVFNFILLLEIFSNTTNTSEQSSLLLLFSIFNGLSFGFNEFSHYASSNYMIESFGYTTTFFIRILHCISFICSAFIYLFKSRILAIINLIEVKHIESIIKKILVIFCMAFVFLSFLIILLHFKNNILPSYFIPTLLSSNIIFDKILLPIFIISIASFLYFTSKNRTSLSNFQKTQIYLLMLFIPISILALINPMHGFNVYWASRRYLVSVLPFIVFSTILTLNILLLRKNTKFVAIICVMLFSIIFYKNYSNRNVVDYYESYVYQTNINFKGTINDLNNFAKIFPANSLVILDGRTVGGHPFYDGLQLELQYTYGINAISPYINTLPEEALISFIKKRMFQNYFIMTDTNSLKSFYPNIKTNLLNKFTFNLNLLGEVEVYKINI